MSNMSDGSGSDNAGLLIATDGLPRARPGQVGIDPSRVDAFLERLAASAIELHSFVLERKGYVAVEMYGWPYGPERPRLMHSVAKSFTACAIGMALDEGRFALTDKVVDFFPRHLSGPPEENLAAMTVEDLLTMRTGHAEETSGMRWRGLPSSWIAEFFKIPVAYRPGTVYQYTSAASYMLSAILTRTTGETLHKYLRPRLFEPLDVRDETWDVGPDGINPGGNGLTCKTIDVLKLGMLHARGGVWDGRHILSERWVAEATRAHSERGYGYHWRSGPGRSFAAMGAFGQLLVVFPEQDATLALTSAVNGTNACTRKLLPLVHEYFPQVFDDEIGNQIAAEERLITRSRRAGETPVMTSSVATTSRRCGALEYRMESNPLGISTLRLALAADACSLRLFGAQGECVIEMGVDRWIESDASAPAPELHHGYDMRPARVVAGARWTDLDTLEMTWIFADSAFRDTVVCRFEGELIHYARAVNVNSGALSQPTITGRRVTR